MSRRPTTAARSPLTVAGILYGAGSDPVRERVEQALRTRPESIVVDAAAVTSVDASGFASLLRARHVAFEAGVALRVTNPSPALRHVAEVAGFSALLSEE
jgi:anti-anti-sigma factor